MDRAIFDKYEAGGARLRQAVVNLTREDLLCKPAADADPSVGKWSIQQVLIHLMDADLIAIDRMKRIIAMENPLLAGFDENLFISKLMPEEQSAQDAVTILDLAYKNFGRVLRKLPEETFKRIGTHNERGVTTLGEYLQYMVNHFDHHLKFIHAKRAKMGKEMW